MSRFYFTCFMNNRMNYIAETIDGCIEGIRLEYNKEEYKDYSFSDLFSHDSKFIKRLSSDILDIIINNDYYYKFDNNSDVHYRIHQANKQIIECLTKYKNDIIDTCNVDVYFNYLYPDHVQYFKIGLDYYIKQIEHQLLTDYIEIAIRDDKIIVKWDGDIRAREARGYLCYYFKQFVTIPEDYFKNFNNKIYSINLNYSCKKEEYECIPDEYKFLYKHVTDGIEEPMIRDKSNSGQFQVFKHLYYDNWWRE